MPHIFRTDSFFNENNYISCSLDNQSKYGLKLNKTSDFISNFEAIYVRGPCFDITIPEVQNIEASKWSRQESKANLFSIFDSFPGIVLNRPSCSLYSDGKLSQLRDARSFGLTIPETLVTNNLEELKKFKEKHNLIIFKSMCPPKIKKDGRLHTIYTNIISSEMIANKVSLGGNLCFFQEYIPKYVEIRAYVIGDKVLSSEIHSQNSTKANIDWRRYDHANTPYYQHELPVDICDKLIQLNDKYGLLYSACDLILTPSGEYYFLEINPDGIFQWIETFTGLPISDEIAKVLASEQ